MNIILFSQKACPAPNTSLMISILDQNSYHDKNFGPKSRRQGFGLLYIYGEQHGKGFSGLKLY